MQAQQANRAATATASATTSATATTSASAPPSSAHHLLGSVRLGLFLGRPQRRRWLEALAHVVRFWGGANSGAPMGAVSQRMYLCVCVNMFASVLGVSLLSANTG